MPPCAHVLKKTFFHVAVSQRTAAKLYQNVKRTIAIVLHIKPIALWPCCRSCCLNTLILMNGVACEQKLTGAAVCIEDRCGTLRRETLADEGPGYAPRQVFEGLVAGYRK